MRKTLLFKVLSPFGAIALLFPVLAMFTTLAVAIALGAGILLLMLLAYSFVCVVSRAVAESSEYSEMLPGQCPTLVSERHVHQPCAHMYDFEYEREKRNAA